MRACFEIKRLNSWPYRLLSHAVLEFARHVEKTAFCTCYYYLVFKLLRLRMFPFCRNVAYTLLFFYIILINSKYRAIVRANVDVDLLYLILSRAFDELLASCYSKSYRLRRWIVRFVIRYIRPRHARYTSTMLELWMRRIHESGTPASWWTRVYKPFVSQPA